MYELTKEDRDRVREDITKAILATPSELCWRIARELADYTVAFVVVNGGMMAPAGVGTLVGFNGSYYILTAAHVWDVLSNQDLIRIPLKENSPCRFSINPREIVPFVIKGASWNAYGPDLAMLRLPRERVGSFTAVGRSFYSLNGKTRTIPYPVVIYFMLGAPAICGEFSEDRAIPEMQGMNIIPESGRFLALNASEEFRSQFDFAEIDIDTSLPEVAADFRGVSGGGLWEIYVYKDPHTGEYESFKVLSGVAFWQEPIMSGMQIRCHGPQSIGALLKDFLDSVD